MSDDEVTETLEQLSRALKKTTTHPCAEEKTDSLAEQGREDTPSAEPKPESSPESGEAVSQSR